MKAVVGSGGLQPRDGMVAVPLTTGFTISATVKVVVQELVQPFALVMVRLSVKVPHDVPLFTETELLMVEPVMVPLPDMLQLYDAMPEGAE
jgi:hypothetical protein